MSFLVLLRPARDGIEDEHELLRVHVIEPEQLTRMRAARVYAYRMPPETFELEDRFWISAETVEPQELVELGDLLQLHADARIEKAAAA